MSVAPNNVNTPQGRAAAANQAVQSNQTQGDKFTQAGQSPNAGSGFGAGRITFDKSGNTLEGGKIIAFAGKQNRDTYLQERGVGNNGIITDQAKFQKADFSGLATYNIPGNKLEEPYKNEDQQIAEAYFAGIHGGQKPDQPKSSVTFSSGGLASFGKSGNAGQAKLAPDQLFRGSAKEDLAKQREADRASKIYSSSANQDYFTGGKPESSVPWNPPLGNQYKNMGQGINNSLIRNSPKEEQVKASEAARASSIFGTQKEYGGNDLFTSNTQKNTKINSYTQSVNHIPNEPQTSQNIPANSFITNYKVEMSEGLGIGESIGGAKNGTSVIKDQNQDFQQIVTGWAKEGDTINVFSGEKQVGSFSGKNAYNDILALNEKYPSGIEARVDYATTPKGKEQLSQASNGALITFQNIDEKGNLGKPLGQLSKSNATPQNLDLIIGNSKSFTQSNILYPQEEKAILASISKNPSYFEKLSENSPGYYQGLVNRGKLQPNDFTGAGGINEIFHSYDRSQSVKNEALIKEQAKQTNDIVSRNDPSYYFKFSDENKNPISVITDTQKQTFNGKERTIGGTKIGPTTTGQRSFYDIMQVNKISPVSVNIEPHFSNRFGYEDITGVPPAITGGKAKLSPNAQRGSVIVNNLINGPDQEWWISPEKTSLPAKGEIPAGLVNSKPQNRVSDLSTSSLTGSKTGVEYTKTNPPLHGGLSAITDSIIGGVGYGLGVSESIAVHLQPQKTSLPTKGEIPAGLVNSTQTTPRNNDLTTALLSGGKTDVQYSKIQNKSNAGYDIYHSIIPFSTYLVHDTKTLLINAGKQINSVNYFVKNSEVKNPNFERPTFNIGELHAANPNLTPEATRLVNKTSSPNPYAVIMGKEPIQKGYTPDYYAVKAVIPFLGAESGLVGVGRVLKPIGVAAKTKIGQLSREAAINYGSPIVSRPAPRVRFTTPTSVVPYENPQLVIFNKPVSPVATSILSPAIRGLGVVGGLVKNHISITQHVETESGFSQRGKIPLGGNQKNRVNVPASVSQPNPYVQGTASKIKEDIAKYDIDKGPLEGPFTFSFKINTEKPNYVLKSDSFNKIPVGGENAGGVTLGEPNPGGSNKLFASGKSAVSTSTKPSTLDTNEFLFTNRGLVAGNISGKPQGIYSKGQHGTISSEHFESTIPTASNEWFTSQGEPTFSKYNEYGVGIYNKKLQKSESKKGNAISGFATIGNAGKQKGLIVNVNNRQIIASGKKPISDVLQVNIPFGGKSATPKYISKYGIIESLSERKSLTGRRQRERSTIPFTGEQSFSIASSHWGTRTEPSDLVYQGGHVKNLNTGYKGAVSQSIINSKLFSDLPQSRTGSITPKYSTSSSELGFNVKQEGGTSAKGYILTDFGQKLRFRETMDKKISSFKDKGILIGQREKDFLTIDSSKLAPRGQKPEIYNENKGRPIKENPSYEPLRFNFSYRSTGGPLKGLITETPTYSSKEYTSNALSPEELALSSRYPLKTSPAYEASFETKFNAFYKNVDELSGHTAIGNWFNKADRVQKEINSSNRSTKELIGNNRGVSGSYWHPKQTKASNDRLQNITHRSFATKEKTISILSNNYDKYNPRNTKASLKSQKEIDISHNPAGLQIFKQLGSKQKKGERQYKHKISFNTGGLNKLFRRKEAKSKVITIKFGENKPYTTKKSTELNKEKLLGKGEHVWFEPQQKSIQNLHENKKQYEKINLERGITNKIGKNQKRTFNQPIKSYKVSEKVRNKEIYEKLTSGLPKAVKFGKKSEQKNPSDVSFSKTSKSTDFGISKENKSTSGNITQLITKQETKKKTKSEQKNTSQGGIVNPMLRYRETNPEIHPSEEYYSFRPGKPPVKPQPQTSKSNSILGMLSGGAGVLSTRSSISQQYGNLNGQLQSINLASAQSSRQSSLYKSLTGLATKQGQKQSLFEKQTTRQTYKNDQIFGQFQSQVPKQSSKQTSQQIQTFISITQPKQQPVQITKILEITPQKQITEQPPPRKIKPIPPLFGTYPKGGKNRKKSGPTGLINLGVNNIFSSSLSISVKKGQRYEF